MESLSSRLQVRGSRWPWASLLATACAAFGAHQSHAQLYKWTDANGKTHYSDTVPPDAVDRARKEIRTDGTVKSTVERAMTADEKRLAAARAADDEKSKIAQTERERKDKALLATYTDLRDFDRVRDRHLAALDDEIKGLAANPAVLAAAAAPAAETPAAAAPASGTAKSGPAKPTAPAAASGKAAPTAPNNAAKANALPGPSAAELERLAQAVAKKRRERADTAATYESERARLAGLLAGERARITTVTVTNPATRK